MVRSAAAIVQFATLGADPELGGGGATVDLSSLSLSDNRGYFADTCQFTFSAPLDRPTAAAPAHIRDYPELVQVGVRLRTLEDGDTVQDVDFGDFRAGNISGVRAGNEHRISMSCIRAPLSARISEGLLVPSIQGKVAALLAESGRTSGLYRAQDAQFYDIRVTVQAYIAAIAREAKGLSAAIQVLQDFGFMTSWTGSDYEIYPVTDLYRMPNNTEAIRAPDLSGWAINDQIPSNGQRQSPSSLLNRMEATIKAAADTSVTYRPPGGGGYFGQEIVLPGEFPHRAGAYLRMVGEAVNLAYQAESATISVDWMPEIRVRSIVQHSGDYYRVTAASHSLDRPGSTFTIVPARWGSAAPPTADLPVF